MECLPAEVWNHTCTFLARSDLAAFALTSSSFLTYARYQLYTFVALHSNSDSIICTFQLLKRSPALARRVLDLTIETDENWSQKHSNSGYTWVDLGLLKQLERMRTLRIKRLPCILRNRGDAIEFVEMLSYIYENCTHLSELILWEFSWPPLLTTSVLPTKPTSRPSLRKIVYNARYSSGINWSFFKFALFVNPSAVTYLDLFIGNKAVHFSLLNRLSFPSLITLYLRSAPLEGMSSIGIFLVAHPSIQHLSLIDMNNPVPQEDLKIDMLPHLKSVYAPPSLLMYFFMKCESLRYIQVLVLDPTAMDVRSFISSTSALCTVVQGFPNLRHCSIPGIISPSQTAEIVDIISMQSRQLTCWSGGFYYRHVKQLEVLAEALARLPSLVRLDICEWTYPTSPPTSEQLEALTYIARKCPSLRKISLYMTHLSTNEILTVYHITWDNGRSGSFPRLDETYRCAEGGPYMKERRYVDYASRSWDDEIVLEGTVG